MSSLLTVLTSIFSKMEWDCSTKEDTLDSSLGLAENNIMSYLGLTEDKTTELLSIQAFLSSKVNAQLVVLTCCSHNSCVLPLMFSLSFAGCRKEQSQRSG